MRARAWLVLAITGAAMLLPHTAAAGCFAACATFMEFDDTYYLPGGEGSGSLSVWIPEKQRESILDAGPYYVWLLPGGTSLREGRPAPGGAVTLGALDAVTHRGETKLSTDFVMPQLPSGRYGVAVCNDPCTHLGIGQPVDGSLWVVATARERELLIRQGTLEAKIYGLQRDARKADKNLDEVGAALGETTRDLEKANEEIATLRTAPRDLPEPAQPSRHLADPWAVIAAAAIVAIALIVRRRRDRSPAPTAASPSGDGHPSVGAEPNRAEEQPEPELVGASH